MIKKIFFSVFCATFSLQAFASESGNLNRIQSLLPNLGVPLNIQPYIPDNFKLTKSPVELPKELNVYFWAPEGEFEKYIENPKSQNRPFIQVAKQECPGLKSIKEYAAGMKNNFPLGFTSSTLHWGPYEVAAIKIYATYDEDYMALIKLNDDKGTMLIFMLMYPKKLDIGYGNRPSKEDLAFWNDFLEKTRAL